jgi:hypothetical protein
MPQKKKPKPAEQVHYTRIEENGVRRESVLRPNEPERLKGGGMGLSLDFAELETMLDPTAERLKEGGDDGSAS